MQPTTLSTGGWWSSTEGSASCGERDVVSYIIWRSKQVVSEPQLKQVQAVISLICVVCGFESPSKSQVVAKVKMVIIKEAKKDKRKIERIGMTRKSLKKIGRKLSQREGDS